MRSLSTSRYVVPLLLAGIMLGGLLLRLVFFWGSVRSGGLPFILDEGNYVGIAGPLSEGQGFVDKWAWLRPPGYPAFLAFFLLLWKSLPTAAFAQILLSVANIGLLYMLATELFGLSGSISERKTRALSLVAAGLLAFNPHAIFYSNLFMPETLYMLALTVIAWSLLRGLRLWREVDEGAGGERQRKRSALGMFALAGLVAAAAIYMRSLLLTFVPLLVGWLWWVLPGSAQEGPSKSPIRGRWSRNSLLPMAVFLAAMFAAILPWTVRNYFEYERFMLVDAVGGHNLWQYNDVLAREEIVARLMEIPNPVDRDRYASEQGVRAILQNPGQFLSDAAGRFVDSWPVETFTELRVNLRNKYPGMDCTYLDVFAWVESGYYIVLGVLAIWGFARAPGRAFKGLFALILLHYAVTTMFAHAEFRYRMPLYPFASLYAAFAIADLRRWAGRKRETGTERNPKSKIQNPKLAALVISVVFLLQSLLIAAPGAWKGVRFERRYIQGKGQMERGDYAGALASFQGAEEIDKGCGCLYRQIGLAHRGLGQIDEERAAYTTALQREEYDWRTAALLSHNLRVSGNPRAPNPIRFTRPEYRAVQQEWAWDNLSPSPISRLDVGGADIGYLKGFEALETEPAPEGEVNYRWTTDRASIRLTPPSGEGKLQLSMRWHSLAWPGKAEPDATVRVLVDGREAGTLLARPGWEVVTLDLTGSDGRAGTRTVELLAPTARPPGGETRQLGVAVDSVELVRGK